jgi:hypothetical protein
MHTVRPPFVALMLALGICRGQVPTVATLFPDVPSLTALKEVFPGITVGQLLALRNPTQANYVGLREVLAGDTVEYRVENPTSRQSVLEDALFGRSRLSPTAIIYAINSWEPTDPSAAEQKWMGRAIALQARTHGEVECFTTKRAGITRTALSRQDNLWLGVQLIEERKMRSLGEERVIPPIVITFASTKLDSYVPSQFSREPITCPHATGERN